MLTAPVALGNARTTTPEVCPGLDSGVATLTCENGGDESRCAKRGQYRDDKVLAIAAIHCGPPQKVNN
ncbi:hypothetical protein Lfu02_11370 [Longispora fulva]|nr:hypothetical protein Lfu02_11370 [Longispora fulva]